MKDDDLYPTLAAALREGARRGAIGAYTSVQMGVAARLWLRLGWHLTTRQWGLFEVAKLLRRLPRAIEARRGWA